jgi:hypothetical protein
MSTFPSEPIETNFVANVTEGRCKLCFKLMDLLGGNGGYNDGSGVSIPWSQKNCGEFGVYTMYLFYFIFVVFFLFTVEFSLCVVKMYLRQSLLHSVQF